ncbi:Heme/copper-type cytochrome/quinol oxidase, subunit 3 [Hyella patelloides LEGE 07179]|uniref:Oxidase aa(3) subunit 3 n=1 Tax=Hyella patelloides LEGE 07179 TaxID=945734 RepID=A0A563VW60_9CYAN|nr:heme-copper oxidase subunit III [Hyella patelloides]VEP15651.1 Heme/copper-type cytochrome/quinol oxidase, subunit 3 [Hyella patelloides LEGE 07179]
MQSSAVNESQVVIDSQQESGHHGHPDHRMFGIILFLISDSMTFLGFFTAFLIYRAIMPVWPPEGTPELELLVPIINTVVLVASSFVMHKGQVALKKNDIKGLQLWFGITAVMGVAFLLGQSYEYFNAEFGLTTNLFASCFYALTGFHGLHVTVGVLLILSVLWRSRTEGHYSSSSHFGVEAAEIYWHFVDVIWLVLFILVYLLQMS